MKNTSRKELKIAKKPAEIVAAIATARKQAGVAKKQAQEAKADFKRARKTYKLAKKAAKAVRNEIKELEKLLKAAKAKVARAKSSSSRKKVVARQTAPAKVTAAEPAVVPLPEATEVKATVESITPQT